MSTESYTRGDLESDLNHLHCLLDQGVWMMQGLPHEGNREQEIADTLVWVARDIVEQCLDRISAMPTRVRL